MKYRHAKKYFKLGVCPSCFRDYSSMFSASPANKCHNCGLIFQQKRRNKITLPSVGDQVLLAHDGKIGRCEWGTICRVLPNSTLLQKLQRRAFEDFYWVHKKGGVNFLLIKTNRTSRYFIAGETLDGRFSSLGWSNFFVDTNRDLLNSYKRDVANGWLTDYLNLNQESN